MLIKNKHVLEPGWIPPVVLYRDDVIEQMKVFFNPVKYNMKPEVFSVSGMPGSGKTLTLKYLVFHGPYKQHSDKFFYLNVADDGVDTANKIAVEICRRIDPNYPRTGLSLHNHLEVIKKHAERIGFLTLILDEVEKVKRDLNDLLYPFVRGKNLSVILISNNISWFDIADIDTRIYRQVRRTILFSSYNAEQIYDILELRVKHGLNEGAMPKETLKYIAALATQRGGDARFGVELLKYSVHVADSKNKSYVSIQDVDEAFDIYENIYLSEFLSRLSRNDQLVILALVIKGGKKFVENKRVYEEYKKIMDLVGAPPTSYWNYLKIIRNLELVGIIESRIKGKDKGPGSYKLIKINDMYLPGILKMIQELADELGLEIDYRYLEHKATLDKYLGGY